MKFRAPLLARLLLPLAVSWLPAVAADTLALAAPIYSNDFQAAALDKVPADFMVMAGAFAVKAEGANLFLELPGAPLENFGLLFGPVSKDSVSATGRFFGSKQGRKFPTFGVSLNGVGGYRLQVSPAKKALEIYKGDDLKISVPYEWASETWTRLRIQVRKTSDNGLAVEGRAWAADAPEPTTWMIALEDKEETPAGRAGIWGSPYSGTPIRFDDLVLTPAKYPPPSLACMNLQILLPAILATATLQAADWPQYRGPSSDGVTAEKISKSWVTGGAAATPKTLWKVPCEGGFSSLSVIGGRAFTLATKMVDGSKQEAIVALDANTGRELWSAPLNFSKYDGGGDAGAGANKGGDGPRTTPAVDATRVYAFSSQLALCAFESATGKPVWKRDLLQENTGRNIQWQNAASPLLEGGLLYVAGGGAGESLLAINPVDGAVVWKAFDEKITHATPVAATILGQRQVIFFLQSGLLSVEPKTGKELWRYAFQYSTSTAASPVVSGDVVYCSAGYGVGAGGVKIARQGDKFVAAEIYRVRGNKPLANHWSTPVVKDGNLYGLFQFKEYGSGPLKCVDIATGNVKWEQPGFGPGQVILAGDQVLALSDAGDLVLIQAAPGAYSEVARAHVIDGKCWSTPVLANGRIYLRSTQEAVCLDVSGK